MSAQPATTLSSEEYAAPAAATMTDRIKANELHHCLGLVAAAARTLRNLDITAGEALTAKRQLGWAYRRADEFGFSARLDERLRLEGFEV